DLKSGPPVRAKLVRLGEDRHLFLLTMHHINTDGWSEELLMRELAAAYKSYRRGEEPGLRELELQYADYAVWQRQWLSGAMLERELGYWKRRFGGELPVLNLATDRPRPAIQSASGGIVNFKLPEEVRRELGRTSREESVTVFMSLLGVLNVL